jgi:tetratricopeptide (TPR) repeat protein
MEEDIHKYRLALLTSDMVLVDANRIYLQEELAGALLAAHSMSHDLGRLEEAITLYEQILDVNLAKHAHRCQRTLAALGHALWRMCEFHDEDAARLRRSIVLLREALDLCPIGHPARADALYNLALALHTGFEQLGGPSLLSEAVTLYRDVLILRPMGHPFRDDSLNGLALALQRQFLQQGGLDILDEAIDLHQHALLLRPPGHPRRAKSLNNLAIAQQFSFQQRGGRETLTKVIALHREALTLRMAGSPFWTHTLNNLSIALFEDFKYYGGFATLAESTALARQTLLLCPPGHPTRSSVLCNLAWMLRTTFEHRGSEDALSEAISLYRETLFLRPAGHADHDISLDGLAHALQIRSDHGGSMIDLHEAILLHREALQLRVLGHPFRDETQYHLAVALEASYQHHRSAEVLAEAVSLHRQALAVQVNSHPDRPLSLMGLASSLSLFAAESNTLDTWKETVFLYEEALALCPKGHPRRAGVSSRLGRCLLNPIAPIMDFDRGVVQLWEGLSDAFAPVKDRLQDAVEDLRAVENAFNAACMHDASTELQTQRHHDVLRLYQQAIELLPRIANFGMDHQTRYRALMGSDEISRNAAARALLLGRVPQAVEMLEEGRGLFWSQALRLRTSGMDDVPEEDRTELQRLLSALNDGAHSVTWASAAKSPEQREQKLEIQRQLNLQAEALITKIRGYHGLQRFLMPAAFDTLLHTLPNGFVIIVNSSSLGCHALLLSRDHALAESLELHVPRSLMIKVSKIKASLRRDASNIAQDSLTDSRAMRLSNVEPEGFEDLLAMLWTTVVNPIVRKLSLQVSKSQVMDPQVMTCSSHRDRAVALGLASGGVPRGTSAVCLCTRRVSTE